MPGPIYWSLIGLCSIVALSGCGDDGPKRVALPRDGHVGRVQAIKAAPELAVKIEDFCESQQFDGGFEPPTAFEWPDLSGPAPSASGRSWRWINFWATWCKPCVEEMPAIEQVRRKLAAAGVEVDLIYVSADTDDAVVERYRRDHPELVAQTSIEKSLRLQTPDILEAWLLGYGLTNPGLLPVHVFVDPMGVLKCVRMTSIGADVYPILHEMMGR